MTGIPAGYEILSRIGEGAYGTVYHAVQTSLRRSVALKILKPTGTVRPVLRFRREAALMGRLHHPYVLKAYDFGFQGMGGYLATEMVAGGSLHRRVRQQGPLRLESALAIAIQLLEALEFAHGRGVIHRDVKPANVLCAGDRTVRLADFGLAYMADETQLSVLGQVIGTPHYMPPEAFDGACHAPGVDIYAVAVTLFELLTGRPPTFGLDVAGALAAKRAGPVIGSAPGVGALSERVRTVLEKALDPRPGERFHSAAELAEALTEVRPSRVVRRSATRLMRPVPPPPPPRAFHALRAWFSDLWERVVPRPGPRATLRTGTSG